jgi:hypothetical protein
MTHETPPTSDVRRILFANHAAPTDRVLLNFANPAPSCALLADAAESRASTSHELAVTVVRPQDVQQGLATWAETFAAAEGIAPVYVRYRGVELLWSPGRAVLLCDPTQVDALLPALAEFARYEAELRLIEQEIAAAWGELEQDNTLAFDVTTTDLARSSEVGGRMERTFRRRIRLARIEPHLGAPATDLSVAARHLGEELREKAAVEDRAEVVSGQLETFEHIYEMASQRMGEYKAARQGHIMELIIIVLLAAEAVLMAVQTILRLHF